MLVGSQALGRPAGKDGSGLRWRRGSGGRDREGGGALTYSGAEVGGGELRRKPWSLGPEGSPASTTAAAAAEADASSQARDGSGAQSSEPLCLYNTERHHFTHCLYNMEREKVQLGRARFHAYSLWNGSDNY